MLRIVRITDSQNAVGVTISIEVSYTRDKIPSGYKIPCN
jgi:hypothetical protein